MEETSNKIIAFQAVDINALATQLNNFIESGGTIISISFSVDKFAYALVVGTEPEAGD